MKPGTFIRQEVPLDTFNVARSRTRGLVQEFFRSSADINDLVANAYLQGVVDVGNNLPMIQKILDQAQNEQTELDHYHGA